MILLCVLKIIAFSCVLKIRPDITFTCKHIKYFAAFRMKLIKQKTQAQFSYLVRNVPCLSGNNLFPHDGLRLRPTG